MLKLDHSFVRELGGLYEPWKPASVPAPRLLALNEPLAEELGLSVDQLRSVEGIALLVGNDVVADSRPVAQAYAGHQFGGLSPRLGDGRALLLGEIIDAAGRRRDLHLKGSGRTPFARGGDGKAAVGPMLREYLIGEAMHALGIPTTRALAVVATGEPIMRETPLPGAVLARVAASHLRVGTFQYAAMRQDEELLRRLADYAIARHHPQASDADDPYLALLQCVADAQASLVSQWMMVGFIHGVMNTDNMTISGETIDYGPCAFMDAYDPTTVFSSIDHGGRYAYGNQPRIALWNLARLAECLLPLIDAPEDEAVAKATAVLQTFPEAYDGHWLDGMRVKLGLGGEPAEQDRALADDALAVLREQAVDYTSFFRALSPVVLGDTSAVRDLFDDPQLVDEWLTRWAERRSRDDREPGEVAAAMDRVNPIYIPRNHLVEPAFEAATAGDMAPFERLLEAVTSPFSRRDDLADYAKPAPPDFGPYRTFCGT